MPLEKNLESIFDSIFDTAFLIQALRSKKKMSESHCPNNFNKYKTV